MFKITKYLSSARHFPQVPWARGFSSQSRCPPKFECKQPKKSTREEELEELKKLYIPSVFVERPHKNPKVYRNIFLFICVPAIICLYINIFYLHTGKHRRPKFVEFSYMRIRKKNTPWGPERTLFHNPRNNALPTGYEIEVPEDEEYDPFEPEERYR